MNPVRLAGLFFGVHLLAATLAAQGCPGSNTTVPNQTVSSGTLTVTDPNAIVASTVTVTGTANATFHATNCVDLQAPPGQAGFSANSQSGGAFFQAWVDTEPQAVSVSPASGTGLSQAFTFVASSPSGFGHLSQMVMIINGTLDGNNACYTFYSPASNVLYLANDDASVWTGVVPTINGTAGSGTASNARCSIDGSRSSVTRSGQQLAVTEGVTFQQTWAGPKNSYLLAYDNSGENSEWQPVGAWTVAQAVAVVLNSAPQGLALTVDGAQSCGAPCALQFASGSQHTVAAASPQTASTGVGYIFGSWADNPAVGAIRTITASNASYTANFRPQDFQVTISGTQAALAGTTASYNVTVSSLNGFSGTVNLAAPGLPSGASASFGATSLMLNGSGSLSTALSVTAPTSGAGNMVVIAAGSSGPLSHTAASVLQIQDYTVTISPPQQTIVPPTSNTLVPTNNGTFTITAVGLNGFSAPISVSPHPTVKGSNNLDLPYSFGNETPCSALTPDPVSGVASCTVSFVPTVNAPVAVVNLGFSWSTSGGATRQSPVDNYLVISTAPSQLSFAQPTLTVQSGSPAVYTLNVTCPIGQIGTFLALTPQGITPPTIPNVNCTGSQASQSFTMNVPAGFNQGNYPVTLEVGGLASAPPTVSAILIVSSGGPTFSITASPVTQVAAPGATATYTVQVTGSASGNVTLTAGTGPFSSVVRFNGGASASVPIGGSATMTVNLPPTAPLRSASLPITGMLGTIAKYSAASVNVMQTAPASILSPPPGAIPGGPTTFTWNTGVGATSYSVSVGSSLSGGMSSGNCYAASLGGATSFSYNVSNCGTQVYLTLTSQVVAGPLSQTYAYTVPMSGPTAGAGAIAVMRGGTEVRVALPVAAGDSVIGISSLGGVSTRLVPGQPNVVGIAATTSASFGRSYVWASTAAGVTIAAPLDIGDIGPDVDNIEVTLSPGGGNSYHISIRGQGFGDYDASVYMPLGFAAISGFPSDNDIEADVTVPVCGQDYEVVTNPGEYDPDSVPIDEEGPQPLAIEIYLGCAAGSSPPYVAITGHTNGITVSPTTTPGLYTASLTSAASPIGGTYSWSVDNTAMVSFSPDQGTNSDHVTLQIGSTGATATITLTYTGPSGGSAQDSFTFALTDDVVALAWLNGTPLLPSFQQLPLGAQDPVYVGLNTVVACSSTLGIWAALGAAGLGFSTNGLTIAEVAYANQFLISHSGNSAPPPSMSNPDGYMSQGGYRLFNRLQLSYEVSGAKIRPFTSRIVGGNQFSAVGTTPDPCELVPPVAAQSNALNGKWAVTADGSQAYSINEGRLGTLGQSVNQYLNGVTGNAFSNGSPWIWNVIEFDPAGSLLAFSQGSSASNLQIFPSYQVYKNGAQLDNGAGTFNSMTVSLLNMFIGLTSSSQYQGKQ